MTLDVRIQHTGGAPNDYRLQCTTCTITYNRPVISSPLAGNASPIVLDLGSFTTQIGLEGVVGETSSADGGVAVPSKVQLENVVNGWWNQTITVTVSGDAYANVKLNSARFTLTAGREDIWDFVLLFSARART